MDRRQTAHDRQGYALFARERLQRRKRLGNLRFLRFLALHGGNQPFEVDQRISRVHDFDGHKYCSPVIVPPPRRFVLPFYQDRPGGAASSNPRPP
jgi:hypothetical protein